MPSERHSPATIAMFVAGFLFAVMGICTKALGSDLAGRPLPAAEVMLFRCSIGVLMMLPLRAFSRVDLLGKDRRGLLMRGISGGLAVYFYFLSLQHTSIANAVLLNYSSLIFAPIISAVALKEKVTSRTIAAVLIALVGMALVTKPQLGTFRIGDLYGLVSGLFAGMAITSIRWLRQTESAWSVFFYLSLVGVPVALIGSLGQPPVMPTGSGWLLLLCMGVASVFGQVLATYGFGYIRAAEGSLITLTQIIYTTAAGVIWFNEPLTALTVAGGLLILGPTLWLSLPPPTGAKT